MKSITKKWIMLWSALALGLFLMTIGFVNMVINIESVWVIIGLMLGIPIVFFTLLDLIQTLDKRGDDFHDEYWERRRNRDI